MPELISKLQVGLQELDETSCWMELLIEAGIVRRKRLEPMMQEANELAAIMVASIRTLKRRRS